MNKKLIAVIVCLSILFTSFVSPEQIAAKKSKLKLNKKKVTMYVGKTVLLKVKGTKQKAKWKSSRKKIAAVSQKGKVTAKKKGSAKITARVGKKKLVCQVTVRNRAVLNDDADQADGSVNQGGSDVPAASGSSAKTSFNPSGGDTAVTEKPDDLGGTDTTKPQETTAVDTSKPQETTAADTTKPQETTAVDTTKPQETTAADTTKPQETTAANTTKPTTPANTTKPTTAANTTKPTTAANTTKPTTAANTTKPTTAANTTKPTTAVNTTKPTTAVNTTKPTTAVNTTKPTAAVNTAEPQSSEEAAATERPQVPIVSKDASFETGTDGFTTRGNAEIRTAEDGYKGNCLCVSDRTSASDGVGYEVEGDLLAGESYAVWAYIKVESGTGTAKVMYRTGEGSDSIHELKTVEVSDQWVKVMGTVTVPEGFTKLDVWFEVSDPTAVFYIDEVSVSEVISVRDTYASLVKELGMCVNPDKLRDADALGYVKKHYTSITMENDMKPDAILRAWDPSIVSTESAKAKRDYIIPDSYAEAAIPELNFTTVDEVLKIARKNGLKIRFHVLVWHSQTPEWFFKEGYSQDENSAYVSEETMNARMEWYIRTVMNHVYTLDGGAYRNVVYAWDVANEYLHNDADKNWSAVYGNREGNLESRPPYIKRAFQLAYEMLEKFSLQDSVSLFYNDYNTYYLVTDQIIDMIHWLNEEKKICSGIGMQSHIGVNFPSVEHYINTLKRFVNEGFEVQITELDVACNEELLEKDQMAAYEQQAEYVGKLMENIVEIQETMNHPITGLTWWGLCDDNSWVKTHALLFGKGGIRDAKPAYFAFINAVKPVTKPAPTPTPTPPTAPPAADYDFIDDDSYKNESPNGAESYINEDGSLTIIFKNQYAAFNFYLPENARNCKGYQAVEIEYTSTGGDLGHSLFDMKAEENGDANAGKHSDWNRRITEHPDGTNSLTFVATDDFYGGCIRGLQIFNPNEMKDGKTKDGKTITITVKSIKFTGLVSNEPAVTAPPEYKVDFEADRKPESGHDAELDVLENGSATLRFEDNYQGVHYLLPNTEEMRAARYRYVTVTYEGTLDEVEVWLYSGKSDLGAASIKDLEENKKVSKVKLTTADGETSVTYSFTDEQPDGGFFRGIQLFHYTGKASMTVKSIVFSKNKPVADGWTSLPVSGMSGGTKGDAETTLSGMEPVTVPLSRKITGKGKQVEVTVNGTLAENSDGFRVWLSKGTETASDQYHFTKEKGVGLGGKGDGDLKFHTGPFTITCVLTVGNNPEADKREEADHLLLKAPAHGDKLTGVTITDIQIREVGESDATHRWVTTWGTAEERCDITADAMPKLPLEDTTVRQIIRVTTGGEKLRLRLSNQYGESDVTVKSLHLAKQVKADESTIDPSTDAIVTVGGKEEFVIPKGKVIQTDAVDFPVNALENVAITSYFGASPTNNITGHRGARATTYQVSGNHVSDETLTDSKTTLSWFFLADASIWSMKESKAVVCFGDSITDGYGTDAGYLGRKPDSYTRWVDYFAKRLQVNDGTKHISVINEGIGSNSILGAYPTDAGKDRFARDLLEHDGVGYCIILFGVNDLNKLENTDKYDDLLPEYQKMIRLCHDNGIKVYGAPILPFGTSDYYSEASEEVRTKINNWMRSAESKLDGIIDFESAVADPENPKNVLEKYTHGDGLHPYDGYEVMADAIDLTMFE